MSEIVKSFKSSAVDIATTMESKLLNNFTYHFSHLHELLYINRAYRVYIVYNGSVIILYDKTQHFTLNCIGWITN